MNKIKTVAFLLVLTFLFSFAQVQPVQAYSEWDFLGVYPGFDGVIYDSLWAADGSLYVVGDFNHVDGQSASGVARYLNGQWSAAGTAGDPIVAKPRAIAQTTNGRIFVGGNNSIAYFNGTSWTSIISGFTGNIYDILADGNAIYVGGDFTNVKNIENSGYLAHWQDDHGWSEWTAVSSAPIVGSAVYTLAFYNNSLYAGGSFSQIGGISTNNIAYKPISSSSWNSLSGNGTSGAVRKLLSKDTTLYVGGDFSYVGYYVSNTAGIAKWSGGSWSAVGSSGSTGSIQSIAVLGTDLYVGGQFDKIANNTSIKNLARWNGTAWSAVGTISADPLLTAAPVTSLLTDAQTLYVGGSFNLINNEGANYFATWNGSNWGNLDHGNGINNAVNDVAITDSNTIYLAGNFTKINNTTAHYLARKVGETWSDFGAGFNKGVYDIEAVSDNQIYAVGDFTTAGGNTVNRVAYWNGSNWAAVGGGFSSGSPRLVYLAKNGSLYVAGSFNITSGGNTLRNIARWDGSSWQPLSTGVNGEIKAIAEDAAGNIYVGGIFTTAGGLAIPRLARWDGQAWSSIGTVSGEVRAITFDQDNNLYLGGLFGSINGDTTLHYAARWDGQTWSALGSGLNDGVFSFLPAADNSILVGGRFTSAGGVAVSKIARWNPFNEEWTQEGGPAFRDDPYHLALNNPYRLALSQDNKIYTVGDFYPYYFASANSPIVIAAIEETPVENGIRLSISAESANQPVSFRFKSAAMDWSESDIIPTTTLMTRNAMITYEFTDSMDNVTMGTYEVNGIVDATPPTLPTTTVETGGTVDQISQTTVTTPSFTWSGADDLNSGVAGYEVAWGTDDTVTTGTYQTENNFAPGVVTPDTYYLRMRVKDNENNYSEWATVFTFILSEELPAANIYEVPTTGTNVDTTVTNTPITLTFPAGFYGETLRLTVGDGNNHENLPANYSPVSTFSLDAVTSIGKNQVTDFTQSYTIVRHYTDEEIQGLIEETLSLYYWNVNTNSWVIIPTTLDMANNTATAVLDHMTDFALMGENSGLGNAIITIVSGGVPNVLDSLVTFETKQLNGSIQESLGSLAAPWVAKDPSGSGQGWHVEISATDFMSGLRFIAIENAKVRQLATNISLVYGNEVPAASQTDFTALSETTPVKLLSAALNQGMGTYQFTPEFTLTIPATTFAGVYTAPVTLSIVTAP